MNKTLYIKEENAETWQKAERYIELFEKKSLSQYLAEHLEKIVERYEPVADEIDELTQRIDELKLKTGAA